MLTSHKSRITKSITPLRALERRVTEWSDKVFRFPNDPVDCREYIIAERLGLQSIEIQLKQLHAAFENSIRTAEEFASASADNDVRTTLLTELSAHLATAADDMHGDIHQWYATLHIRLNELDVQETRLPAGRHVPDPDDDDVGSTTSVVRRLPSLPLPKFSGNFREFHSFWIVYSEMIHENEEIGNVDKLLRLRQCLSGDAAKLINDLPLVAGNYQRAVDALCKRFDKGRCTTDIVIEELDNLNVANETARSCRTTFDTVSQKLLQLECSGLSMDNTPIWRRLILSKFPPAISEYVLSKESKKADRFTVNELLDKIESRIALKEAVELTTKARGTQPHGAARQPQNNNSNNGFARNDKFKKHQSSDRSNHRFQPRRKCICDSCDHSPHSCTVFATPQLRRAEAKRKQVCWKCFEKGHRSVDCPDFGPCPKCSDAHHLSLCIPKDFQRSPPISKPQQQQSFVKSTSAPPQKRNFTRSQPVSSANAATTEVSSVPLSTPQQHPSSTFGQHSVLSPDSSQFVLMTADAVIYNEAFHDYEPVVLFLDPGAQRSFISSSAAERLKLRHISSSTSVTVSGIGENFETFSSQAVEIRVRCHQTSRASNRSFTLQTMERVVAPFSSAHLSQADLDFLKTMNINLAQTTLAQRQVKPDILIGQDLIDEILTDSNRIRLPSGLRLSESIFGWIISGTSETDPQAKAHLAVHSIVIQCPTFSRPTDLRSDLDQLYELEAIGLRSEKSMDEEAELRFMDEYRKSITLDGQTIVAGFPFLETVSDLRDNFNVAYRRLGSLVSKLVGEPENLKLYFETIQQYLDAGIAEEVSPLVDDDSVTSFYLPHRYVSTPGKSTSFRIVFDGSAKARGELSINDVIFPGFSMLPKINEIMLEFRTHPLVMISDIQRAFLTIKLPKTHRDAVRFIFIRDANKPLSRDNIRFLRFTSVPFGINSSPAILNHCLLKQLESQPSETNSDIMKCLYVDNIMFSGMKPSDLIRKYHESKSFFKNISMNLRDYVSNSDEVNKSIPQVDLCRSSTVKMLGLPWSTASDELILSTHIKPVEKPTKASVLSQVNGLMFDSLGLITPLIAKMKVFLQDLHAKKLSWKNVLSDEDSVKWKQLVAEVAGFEKRLPRQVSLSTEVKHRTIAIFVDSSKRIYAASLYVVTTTTSGYIFSRLFMAKSKVASLKTPQTIPKLEVTSAYVGLSLAEYVLERFSLPIRDVHVFSDSTIALAWIHSSKLLPNAIANVIRHIHACVGRLETKSSVTFHHVSSDQNVADCATRGLTGDEIASHPWWTGPSWLSAPPDQWKSRPVKSIASSELESVVLQCPLIEEHPPPPIREPVFPIEKFSAYDKLRRVTAYALRFIRKCSRNRFFGNTVSLEDSIVPSGSEMRAAQRVLIKQAQSQVDLDSLRKSLKQFDIRADEHGVVRRYSRLSNSGLKFDAINPVYLPKHCALAKLIARRNHLIFSHCGPMQLQCFLRSQFWIPSDGVLCKQVVRSCCTCRKFTASRYQFPSSGPLPSERVTPSPPYSFTGVDMCGPFTIRDGDNEKKYYIALFTCLVTRNVHLEVTSDMSAKTFLLALRRFVAKCGVPRKMLSDNGSNFRLTEMILSTQQTEVPPDNSVSLFVAEHDIDWSFIPPSSPHMGGVWERIVGIVKRTLHKTIGREKLDLETFTTFVAEAAAIANDRPLTALGQHGEKISVLTPSSFFYKDTRHGMKPLDLERQNDPDFLPSVEFTSQKQARDASYAVERLTAKCWRIYRELYLADLPNIHKLFCMNYRSSSYAPAIGDIVLIDEETMVARGCWPLGIIVDLCHSRDDSIRSAFVRTGSGKVLHRPLNRLINLEIRASSKDFTEPPKATEEAVAENDDLRVQPPRAAKKAVSYVEMPSVQYSFLLLCIIALIPSSSAIALSCILGGVSVDLSQISNISTVAELCINDRSCEQFTIQSRQNIRLKDSQITKAFTASLRFLANHDQHFGAISCPEQHICDLIDCFWCASFWHNPTCNPRLFIWSSVILGLLFLLCSLACSLGCVWLCFRRKCCFGTPAVAVRPEPETIEMPELASVEPVLVFPENNPSSDPHPSHFHRAAQTDPPPPNERQIPLLRSIWIKPSKIVSFAIILNLIQLASGCLVTHVISGDSEICPHFSDAVGCQSIVEKSFTMSGYHPSLCLQLGYKNKTVAHVQLFLDSVQLRCFPITTTFTRDINITTRNVHRCAFMGSCGYNACGSITRRSYVKELNSSYAFAGITRCTPSCYALPCLCGLPFESCIFSRTIAEPVSPHVYEVFRCAAWSEDVSLTMNISFANGTTTSNKFVIGPHDTFDRFPFQASLQLISHPPLPLTNSKFIKTVGTNSQVAVLPDQNIALLCNSTEQALSHSQCMLRDVCTCESHTFDIACNCDAVNISAVMSNLDYRLPLQTPHFVARYGQFDKDLTISSHSSIVELTLSTDVSWFSKVVAPNDQKCSVEASPARGCYRCQSGAIVDFECISDTTILAEVVCTDHHFALKCSENGTMTSVRFHSRQAQFHEECTAKCGHGTNHHVLHLGGILSFHSEFDPATELLQSHSETASVTYSWPEFWHFLEVAGAVLEHSIPALLLSAIAVLVLFFFAYKLFRYLCQH